MTLPQIEKPVEGIELIADVHAQPSINTIEGEIGALLWGENFQSYFLEMPPGAYLEEHPHPFECVVYTVRGSYVLASRGKRCVMKPGSIMSFAADTPTGYEVPFDEPSYILVVRGDKPQIDAAAFLERLQEYASEGPALLRDLPGDHPACQFARSVNPGFFAS